MKYAKHTTGKTFRSFMLAAGMLSGMAMHAQLDMGCGFDVMHQQLMSTDPVYAQRVNAFSTMVQNAVPSFGRSLTTYKVPVVVHVMETGTAATAITDAQIRAFIKRTNEYWRKAPGSLGDGSGEDMTIEFVLAVRDPQGNCTTGITRTDMTWNTAYVTYGVGGSGISDADLKSYQHWSPTNYYNIWLVGTIAGAGGYAAFAVNHGSPTDGAVMRAGSTGSYLMAHEMGHAFNLYHTYAGDNGGTQCPPNANPSVDGDEVWDTPPHIRPSGCNPTGTNACDNNSLNSLHQYNYLNLNGYPYCDPNMFTAGQRDRAVLALTGLRASFLASNGNMSLVPPAAPQLDFSASTNMICGTGQTVTIDDLSSCLPDTYLDDSQFTNITYAWSITNGVDTYTSSVRRPTFTLNSLGIYNVTLTVTTSLGTFTRTENGVVVVVAAPVAACTPTTTLVGGYGQVVNNVIFNTISSYTSPATNAALTDLSCTHKTILAAGGTYPLAVTIRAGGTGPEVLMGYIDYNNNGIFEDPSELVISGSTPANSSATINANVTLPIGAVTNTLLRMRLFGEVGTLTANERNCLAATYIGDAEDYGVYISNALASVSIGAAPGTTFTYGTNVTFTPTPVNGGASPVYTWFRNGVPVATGSTYQSNNLLPGETIRCEMASNLAGVLASPAISNTLTMTVTGPPLSEFSAAPRALCPGGTVTFTDASALSPTSWSWSFPGGTPSSSTAQNPVVTYNTPGTYSVTLVASNANGAGSSMTKTGYITVFNAPAAACTHTRTQSPGADVGITNVTLNTINHSTPNNDAAMNDFTCSQVTALQISTQYPISVRGGLYNMQWFRVYIDYNNNGVFTDAGELVFAPANAMGTVTGTFTTPPNPVINTLLRMRVINDNAAWNAIPGPCTNVAVGQSEDYGVYFTPSTVASVSIAASPSSTVTSGTLVTFTPTPVNGGGAPTYQWFRNNIQVGTGSTYQSNSFATGETVHCVMTSNLPGVIGSPATSNTVTMTVSPVPCTAPTATATPVCAGAQYGVNVNLTNMGSATSIAIQVDNDAGGPNGFSTVQTVTGTGNYGPFGAYASGAAIHVRLAHNLDAGCNLNLNNVVTTCTGPGSTCQYSSTTTTNIVDNTTVTNTINVPALGGQVITDLDVFVNITHPNSADLRLSLQSPTGTTIALINTGVCGTNDNMTVEFDQQATTAIGVVCPMTNIYAIPSASLAGFNTQVMQGTWTLSVQDVTTGNTGVLNSWCLMPTLAPAPCVAPTATATPVCAGAQYGVNVNLTNMGSATSIAIQVDNDAGGPNGFSTVQTVTGTGNYGPFGAYASGAAVHVRLVHNLDAGCNLNLNNVVTTCSGPGSTCTYSSTTPTNIVDNTTVTNTITVPPLGGQTITDLDVFVNITHTYVGDLLLSLQSPTGTTIALINTGLCGSADNMTVEFDQQAGSAIGAVCPMTNIYAIPTGSLAGFNGELMQGIWTLSVQDVAIQRCWRPQ